MFGLYPYLEDDVYDKVREQIEHRFSDDTLCIENVWMEALKQGILKAYDTEDDKYYDLTLEMLKKGLEIYLNLEYTNKDLELWTLLIGLTCYSVQFSRMLSMDKILMENKEDLQ